MRVIDRGNKDLGFLWLTGRCNDIQGFVHSCDDEWCKAAFFFFMDNQNIFFTCIWFYFLQNNHVIKESGIFRGYTSMWCLTKNNNIFLQWEINYIINTIFFFNTIQNGVLLAVGLVGPRVTCNTIFLLGRLKPWPGGGICFKQYTVQAEIWQPRKIKLKKVIQSSWSPEILSFSTGVLVLLLFLLLLVLLLACVQVFQSSLLSWIVLQEDRGWITATVTETKAARRFRR